MFCSAPMGRQNEDLGDWPDPTKWGLRCFELHIPHLDKGTCGRFAHWALMTFGDNYPLLWRSVLYTVDGEWSILYLPIRPLPSGSGTAHRSWNTQKCLQTLPDACWKHSVPYPRPPPKCVLEPLPSTCAVPGTKGPSRGGHNACALRASFLCKHRLKLDVAPG